MKQGRVWNERFLYCLVLVKREQVLMRCDNDEMSWSCENKSFMRVDESSQARVCLRVF